MFPAISPPPSGVTTPQTPKQMLTAERKRASTPCTPVQTIKYFGDHARDNFFERSRWLSNQLKITELNSQQEAVKALYFGDELDKCAMEEEVEEQDLRRLFERRTFHEGEEGDEGDCEENAREKETTRRQQEEQEDEALGIDKFDGLDLEVARHDRSERGVSTTMMTEVPDDQQTGERKNQQNGLEQQEQEHQGLRSRSRSESKHDRTNSAILGRRSGTSMAITPKYQQGVNGFKNGALFPLHSDEMSAPTPSKTTCFSPGGAKVEELLARRRTAAAAHTAAGLSCSAPASGGIGPYYRSSPIPSIGTGVGVGLGAGASFSTSGRGLTMSSSSNSDEPDDDDACSSSSSSSSSSEFPTAKQPAPRMGDRSFSTLANALEAVAEGQKKHHNNNNSNSNELSSAGGGQYKAPRTAGTSGAVKYADPLLAQSSEDVLGSLAIPTSPRTAYLVNCNKSNVLPRPSLVLRKQFTKDLNLAHKGMGDHMATLVAESIDDLPYIESLNISDNNLSCAGLCAFFNAISKIKGFKHLDVSDNILGPDSSAALANYLTPDSCPLVQLAIRNADIDDFECARFIGALSNNNNIRDIDMSHNKLGTAETLNVINPDVVTASEALADMLAGNSNHLERLNVSWNMIRLDGGTALVSSLVTNVHLLYLDLSYNALGQEGGVALGRAITCNRTLKYLNISSNGICESACITIVQGIMCNDGLEQLFLDGNPIGEQGQMALMQLTLVPRSTRLALSAVDCNQFIRDDMCVCRRGKGTGMVVGIGGSCTGTGTGAGIGAGTGTGTGATSHGAAPAHASNVHHGHIPSPPLTRFDSANPLGVYELDLSHQFDQAVAGYVMDLIARHSSFRCQSVTLEEKGKKPEPLELKSIWHHVGESCYSETEKLEIAYARHRIEILQDEAHCVALFERYCNKFTGAIQEFQVLEREYFYYFLQQELGFAHIVLSEVDEIIEAYDVDGSWSISLTEFKLFIVQYRQYLEVRVTSLIRVPILSLNHSNEKYMPPTSGILRFEVIDGVFKKSEYTVLSSLQLQNLCELAKISQNATHYLSNTVKLIKVRLSAALHLYRIMYAENAAHRFKIIPVLLRSVDDYWEARRFLSIVTSDNREDMQQVRHVMGYPLKTLLHFFDGYYSLNLKDEGDRNCLARLLDASQKINHERQQRCILGEGLIGDLSQHGNWTCFRNETLNKRAVEITPATFLICPEKGILQFDFFTGLHPKRSDSTITNTQFLAVLKSVFLINEDDFEECMGELRKYKVLGDCSNSGDGRSIEHAVSKERREQIFVCMDQFYSNLALRPDREAMQFDGKPEVVEKGIGPNRSSKRRPTGLIKGGKDKGDKEKEEVENNIKRTATGTGTGTATPTTASAANAATSASFGGDATVACTTSVPSASESAANTRPNSSGGHQYQQYQQFPLLRSKDKDRERESDDMKYRFSQEDYQPPPPLIAPVGIGSGTSSPVRSTSPKKLTSSSLLRGSKRDSSHDLLNNRASGESEIQLSALDRAEKDKEATRLFNRRTRKSAQHRQELKMILMEDKHGPQFKALRVADILAERLLKGFVSCSQLRLLVSVFTQGKIWIYDHGAGKSSKNDHNKPTTASGGVRNLPGGSISNSNINSKDKDKDKDKPFHYFGTYRVELIISMIPSLIDIYNLDMVLSVLSPEEVACITCRVGYWNGIINPMKPEGHHYFNLHRHVEERQVLKLFIVLSKLEPGTNWSEESFRFKLGESDVGGFKMGMDWMSDEGLYKNGLVQFTFCSAKLSFMSHIGHNISGIEDHVTGHFTHTPAVDDDEFKANPGLRRALCYFTGIDPAMIMTEEQRAEHPKEVPPPPADAMQFFQSAQFLATEPEPFKHYLTAHPKSRYASDGGVGGVNGDFEHMSSFAAPVHTNAPSKSKK